MARRNKRTKALLLLNLLIKSRSKRQLRQISMTLSVKSPLRAENGPGKFQASHAH
jgi:hypothetical protein